MNQNASPALRRPLKLALGLGAGLSAFDKLYGLILRAVLRRNARRLMAGDTGPLLRTYADDAVLVLDGRHSWAGEHRGKQAIEAFLDRFLETGIRGELHEILVQGPPWRTLVAARFTDVAKEADGTVFYENHAIMLGTVVWGKITHQRVYEDTQRVADLDAYIESRDAAGAAAPAAAPTAAS